jgi:peptide/nickel transport system permease protein
MIAGTFILLCFTLMTIFAQFLAPYDYRTISHREPSAPRSVLHLQDVNGHWHARPFFYRWRLLNPRGPRYEEDHQRAYPIEFFTRGEQYAFLGRITTDIHLFGVRKANGSETPRVYLLGTDDLGRDRLSRLLIASRFSMTVAPLGTLLAGALGVLIGCIAGYKGGWVDVVLMRLADTMMALPTLVVVMAVRAIFPPKLPFLTAGALLVMIFVILGWAGMARLTRGLVMELRDRDYVVAAKSIGLSPARVLWRHIGPNIIWPLVVQLLLMLPTFLLAETALSFFGIGLQAPEPSWGNILSAASNIELLKGENGLLLLTPAITIVGFVLGVRLLSDGLEAKIKREQL